MDIIPMVFQVNWDTQEFQLILDAEKEITIVYRIV